MINLKALSFETREAWNTYLATFYGDDFPFDSDDWPTAHACFAAEILAHTTDDPIIFPKGKWASIQTLKSLIQDDIVMRVTTRGWVEDKSEREDAFERVARG